MIAIVEGYDGSMGVELRLPTDNIRQLIQVYDPDIMAAEVIQVTP